MDYHERIVADPAIMIGKPVIKGTRITVELVLQVLADGMTVEEVIHAYPQLQMEDIFAVLAYSASVVAGEEVACSEEEKSELMRLTAQPLGENLIAAAMVIQQKLADPKTVALLRAVIGEVARFPHLADMTYKSLVGHFEIMVERLLSEHYESQGLGNAVQQELSVAFVNQLVGVDVFRALLGLPGASRSEQRQRAEIARDRVLVALK